MIENIKNPFFIIIKINNTKIPFIINYDDYNSVIYTLNKIKEEEYDYESEYDKITELPNLIIEILKSEGINANFIEYYNEDPIEI